MRLLTYNIHKGIGGRDRRYSLDRVARVVAAENPDVVCLQEVTRHAPRTGHDDQPQLLADLLQLPEHAYQMNVHYRNGGYGNLLLSRWPLARTHHVSLRYQTRKPRGAQIVVVDTPHGQLHVVHWHLGLSERERLWQAAHLLEHPLFRESKELPTLIVGDSNDWRNSLAKGPLAAGAFEQISGPPSRFRTFPAYLSVLSLDKAFHNRGIEVIGARVPRSRLTRAASDHLPLLVDFHLAAAVERPAHDH